MRRACVFILAGLGFLVVGGCAVLLAFIVVVLHTPPRHDQVAKQPTVVVSATVSQPTYAPWSPPPTSIPQDRTPPTDYGIPPDPHTGPFPYCWIIGPIPGQPCPPKPPGWTPPPR